MALLMVALWTTKSTDGLMCKWQSKVARQCHILYYAKLHQVAITLVSKALSGLANLAKAALECQRHNQPRA